MYDKPYQMQPGGMKAAEHKAPVSSGCIWNKHHMDLIYCKILAVFSGTIMHSIMETSSLFYLVQLFYTFSARFNMCTFNNRNTTRCRISKWAWWSTYAGKMLNILFLGTDLYHSNINALMYLYM
jgi:hypothetical protein